MFNLLPFSSSSAAGPIYITSYTLHGLQPASLFEVSVLARNSFGWSDNSRIVRFATGGEGKFQRSNSLDNCNLLILCKKSAVELPNYSTESELQYDVTEEIFDNEIKQRSQILTASMTYNGAASIYAYSACGYITILIQIGLVWRYT